MSGHHTPWPSPVRVAAVGVTAAVDGVDKTLGHQMGLTPALLP
mgnify:CR=1 FL=1